MFHWISFLLPNQRGLFFLRLWGGPGDFNSSNMWRRASMAHTWRRPTLQTIYEPLWKRPLGITDSMKVYNIALGRRGACQSCMTWPKFYSRVTLTSLVCIFSIMTFFFLSHIGIAHISAEKRWFRGKMCHNFLNSHTGSSMGSLTHLQVLTQQTPKLRQNQHSLLIFASQVHQPTFDPVIGLLCSLLDFFSKEIVDICRAAVLHRSCSFTDVLGPSQTQELMFASFCCFQHVSFEDKPCSIFSSNPTLKVL